MFRFLSGEGLLRPTVSSNCTQLYILLTFRTFQVSNIRIALKVVESAGSRNYYYHYNIVISIGLTDLCGCFDRDAILVDEKVTGAARFIDAIAMFPFSKTKHVR